MEPLIDARIKEWSTKLDDTFAKTGDSFDFAWWAVLVHPPRIKHPDTVLTNL